MAAKNHGEIALGNGTSRILTEQDIMEGLRGMKQIMVLKKASQMIRVTTWEDGYSE